MLKKRFIAGVTCPKCNALDKIILLTSLDQEWIECIACNYKDKRPEFTPPADDISIVRIHTK